ncbi:MAG: NAD(P)/FAD-dependent oxidoreductase [Patescibacteria group bacterium]
MTLSSSHRKPHIVILGAGFGGIYTFLNLRRRLSPQEADITIINRTNYFLFTPLLHEVATGGLSHHQVVEAIRSIIYKRGAVLHVAEIRNIDTRNKTVETSVGPVPYDILVIATGATSEFHGIPGAPEKTFVLKNLNDAIKIRNRFIDAFEKAVEIKDHQERRKLLTFVIVGGGATGVELAAEMTDLFFDTFRKFFCGKIPMEDVTIHLITGDTELLRNFHGKMRARAKVILSQKGVNVRTGARVLVVDENGVSLNDGSRIESKHVLWLAGVSPNVPPSDKPFTRNSIADELATGKIASKIAGRIIVDRQMKARGHENIYALGDVATFEDEFLPMHAQTAVQAARVVAQNIFAEIYSEMRSEDGKRREKPGEKRNGFYYRSAGDLVSLGQWQAVGYFLKILWVGPLAWFIWRTVYLFKFASWSKRVKIAVDWTIDIFYPRDITRA